MVARRVLAFLAALFAAALVAGCAKTVSGQGSFAEGQGGTTTSPTSSDDSPSESPSESSSESESPSESSSSGGDDTNEVCSALDKSEVEKQLGSSVTLKQSQSTGCQITASNGKSLIVAVFDFLTLSEYKKGQFKNLQVGGHPAIKTDSNIIYVARSSDPAAEGLLAAYFSGLGTGGDSIASSLLAQLLKKYAK
ncbi:MAG TPA: hypothetical protein VMU51_11695 [Mycobacteriales bacterium]|nr:hypothetical protein [Mycobacteriales bacterium]